MRAYHCLVVRTRRFKVAANSAHGHAIEPNLLGQHFSATVINKK
ncbi:hypothetical protein DmAi_25230 [Acetobacter persici]|uniref:Uncharacterized protein n=1 Tax=Acetobacter persici TaxID=1076596 RepID=A0A6V8IB61_9PROT|nr:hypothetical protein DmAi_25230 [Acetobacter persici]